MSMIDLHIKCFECYLVLVSVSSDTCEDLRTNLFREPYFQDSSLPAKDKYVSWYIDEAL